MSENSTSKSICDIFTIFSCITLCGCRDRVTEKMVFFPPPCSYSFKIQEVQGKEMSVMFLVDENGTECQPFGHPDFHISYTINKKGHKICYYHIKYPLAETTILFSHGNATDIGHMRSHLLQLAKAMKCNILAYDYSGYGLSEGKVSSSSAHSDIFTIYDLYLNKYKTQYLIIYGQSLGTGPSLYLAKQLKRDVDGVVIHSGLMSAMRVLEMHPKTQFFDILRNIDVLPDVVAPVFIIHGKQDEEIPLFHAEGLVDVCKHPYKPFFVDGAGHNNIEFDFRAEYLTKLYDFIQYINTSNTSETNVSHASSDADDERKYLNASDISSEV